MMKRMLTAAALAAGLMWLGPQGAQAQLFGAQANFGSDTDFGVGARLVLPLATDLPLDFQAGFNLFFPEGSSDYWEANGNLWYIIPTRSSSDAVPYVGGGINLGVLDRGSGFDSDTEFGLNLGGGVRFEFANTVPFIEARFVIGGVEQFVIGGGFLFGSF